MTLTQPPAQDDVERGDVDAADSVHSSRSSMCMSVFSAAHAEDDVLTFLCEDEGPSPATPPRPVSEPQSLLYLSRTSSTPSVNTLLSAGTLVLDLRDLCVTVHDRRSLRNAEIRCAEQYRVFTGTVIHRFLVLELHRAGRKPIWVRLDRFRGGGWMKSLVGGAPARDEAVLKADKRSLIGSAVCENRQLFETVPTLGELALLLNIVSQEMTVYTAWPENCYFFCSLIQQHLGAENDGTFLFGKLSYPNLAKEVRKRVHERVRLVYHMPPRFTLVSLVQSLDPDRTWPLSGEMTSISNKLAGTLTFGSRRRLVHRLCQLIAQKSFARVHEPAVALAVFDAIHSYLRALPDWPRLNSQETPSKLRRHYGAFLASYKALLSCHSRLPEACEMGGREVLLMRHIYLKNPDGCRPDLADSLLNHSILLRKAGRLDEACVAGAESVELQRAVYTRHVKLFKAVSRAHAAGQPIERVVQAGDVAPWHRNLSLSLLHYSISLLQTGHFDKACDAAAESVSLIRLLYAGKKRHYRRDLSICVHHYGRALYGAGRFQEACDASREDVALQRRLYWTDTGSHRKSLSVSLHYLSVALLAVQHTHDACQAAAESVSLLRALNKKNPDAHCRELLASLVHLGVALQEDGQIGRACNLAREAVALARIQYQSHPQRGRARYRLALELYCRILRRAGHLDQAREMTEELERARSNYIPDVSLSDPLILDHARADFVTL